MHIQNAYQFIQVTRTYLRCVYYEIFNVNTQSEDTHLPNTQFRNVYSILSLDKDNSGTAFQILVFKVISVNIVVFRVVL